ncbi:MAG TPA: hypothetical protein VFA67_09165, partial [Candidatus Sulfotelmatobacter sp.]|nr:hypothetical protein [Candidatus Sulfotelmatobacter sp.]
ALQETTRRLKERLDSLAPGSESSSAAPMPMPEQMSGLLSELMRAGEWLRRAADYRDDEVEHELSEYRRQVERLRALLPLMQRALLNERARLERERERVHAAAEWARGSQQTLSVRNEPSALSRER